MLFLTRFLNNKNIKIHQKYHEQNNIKQKNSNKIKKKHYKLHIFFIFLFKTF